MTRGNIAEDAPSVDRSPVARVAGGFLRQGSEAVVQENRDNFSAREGR